MLPARLLRLVVLSGALLSLASCGLLVGLGNYAQEAADAAAGDGSTADGPGRDSGEPDGDATLGDSPFDAKDTTLGDAPPSDSGHTADADASPDAPGPPDGAIVYNDIAQGSNWETLDLQHVGLTFDEGFYGAVFDGTYLYLVPYGNGTGGTVLRFDTTMSLGLGAMASWTTFDATQLNPGAAGFRGGVFDGRYVYFAPNFGTVAVRYDVTQAFSSQTSWEAYDLGSLTGNDQYNGAGFDGRYIYLIPFLTMFTDPSALVSRFDTKFSPGDGGSSAFGVAAAWSQFNIGTVSTSAGGYAGGVFDGHFLYVVPFHNVLNADPYGNFVARYDTAAPFIGDGGAWTDFYAGDAAAGSGGFSGGVFDGQYVYFVPQLQGTGTADGVVARYDTGSGASTTFDLTPLNAGAIGFNGGAFDGRYVYLVPGDSAAPGAIVSRYDTMAGGLAAQNAWSFFDARLLIPDASAGATTFGGGAFDGRYVYLVPFGSTVLARFDARTRAPVPSTIHGGSFF